MKINILYLINFKLVILINCFIWGCQNGDDASSYDSQSVHQLTQLLSSKEEFIRALNSEMSEINSALSEIAEAHGNIPDSIADPIERIKYFDSLLADSKEKINRLERQKNKVASTSEQELISSIIENLKETILEKENYIARLKYENDTLKSSNTILQYNLVETQNSISKIEAINDKQKKEIEQLSSKFEREKQFYTSERERMRNELSKAREDVDIEKSNAYFEIALALKEEFDKTKSGFLQSSKNKIRKELINNAYEYFRRACLLGNKSSSSYIRILLTEETYSKELSISRSSTSISNCGV